MLDGIGKIRTYDICFTRLWGRWGKGGVEGGVREERRSCWMGLAKSVLMCSTSGGGG